ncbi:hypothetical protein BDV96DRAFT_642549 [Lophiotrema nucula]|uniref:Uncharacterized protein n=1 Tax=Lophiotrema nucula TaxID=690887 RepID=A0A6A5ZIU3_9PLEO|nr:hypothetical protein BDV96DRAFT_642549 [Lophiotrema nucula]
MRFSTLTITLATATLTAARIIGIAAPATLGVNSTFPLTLITEDYIQAVYDVSVAWGFSAAPGHLYSLGEDTQSAYLGPSKSNILTNITIDAKTPENLDSLGGKPEKVVLAASLFSLYGVSQGPTVANFNITVNVGSVTGGPIVRSDDFVWGTGQC